MVLAMERFQATKHKKATQVVAGALPIIYIHKGYCPYLRLSLLQARKTNPHAQIVLLGNEANEKLAQEAGAAFYPFENYFSAAANFFGRKIFRRRQAVAD